MLSTLALDRYTECGTPFARAGRYRTRHRIKCWSNWRCNVFASRAVQMRSIESVLGGSCIYLQRPSWLDAVLCLRNNLYCRKQRRQSSCPFRYPILEWLAVVCGRSRRRSRLRLRELLPPISVATSSYLSPAVSFSLVRNSRSMTCYLMLL